MTIIGNKMQTEVSLDVDALPQGLIATADMGAELKQAREANKISVSDVATKLKLTKSVIDNLEANAWDKLNGRTYARGYLTSYANFLGLSVTDFLTQFDESYQEELPPLKVHRNHVKKRDFPWLKLFSLILLGLAVWFVMEQWPEVKAKFMTQVNGLSNEADILIENDVDTAINVEMPAPSSVIQEAPPLEEPPLIIETVVPEQIGNDQVTTLTLPELTPEVMLTAEERTEPSPVVTPTESVITTEGTDPMQATLALAFGGTCWVNVKDAAGKTLMNETKQAGEHTVLTGKSPLQIILGDALHVKVRFNGTLFNTQPFTSAGGVARFTINNKQL